MLTGRLHQLLGHPGEIRLDQPELRQRVPDMGVEACRDQKEIRSKGVERRQDSRLEGGAEIVAVVARLERRLKMLPTPVSSTAPVPGNSGIWWVEP